MILSLGGLMNKELGVKTINEIFQDTFFLGAFLKSVSLINNEISKCVLSLILKDLSIIYTLELSKCCDELNVISKQNFFVNEQARKKVSADRQWIKKEIHKSKELNKKKEKMEIDFDNDHIYDICLLYSNNKILLGTNIELFENESQHEYWNELILLLSEIGSSVYRALKFREITYDQLINCFLVETENSRRMFEALTEGSYQSYSSGKLFKNSYILNNSDKNFILHRYRLIKSMDILLETYGNTFFCIKDGLNDCLVSISLKSFIRKAIAVTIVIIGNEICNMNTSFSKYIMGLFENEISETSFFKLNRKVRNNIHYKEIEQIDENDILIIDKYQKKYLKTLISAIDEQLSLEP